MFMNFLFFIAASFFRLLRPPQLPAKVAAEARRICRRSSRFCAAIEASLYDPHFGLVYRESACPRYSVINENDKMCYSKSNFTYLEIEDKRLLD